MIAHGEAIAKFLGEGAARGPLALLGLRVDQLDEVSVLAALDLRLSQVAKHPQRDTPAADEVRLALHAVAAQLLDPRVVALLKQREAGQGVAEVAMPRVVETPRVAGAPVVAPAPAAFVDEVRAVVGASGGVTQTALERVRALAALRGVGVAEMVQVVAGLAGGDRGGGAVIRQREVVGSAPTARRDLELRKGSGPASRTESASSQTSTIDQVTVRVEESFPPVKRGPVLVFALAGALIGFVLLAGLVVMAWAVVSARSAGKADAGVRETPVGAPVVAPVVAAVPGGESVKAPELVAAAKVVEVLPARAEPSADDVAGIVREVRELAEAVDPGGAAALAVRIEAAVGRLAAVWPRVPGDQLAACTNAIVEGLYRLVDDSAAGARAAAAIVGPIVAMRESGSVEPLPWAWSVGMVRRLSRESDLPGPLRSAVAAETSWLLSEPGGGGDAAFESGVRWALGRWAASSGSAGADTWEAWGLGLDAVGIESPSARSTIALAALEQALVGDASVEAITGLVRRLEWREGDPARAAAVRWIRDQRVGAGAAARLIDVMMRSSVGGVDATMALPAGASAEQRGQLAERLSAAWGLESSPGRLDFARERWVATAGEAVAARAGDVGELGMTARLALLNEAAAWIWRGESVVGAELAEAAEGAVTRAGDVRVGAAAVQESGPSDWAARFAASRANAKERREVLDLASRLSSVTLVDAGLIVQEWMTSQGELRTLAGNAILRHAGSRAMARALLDKASRLPANRSTVEMVERVAQRKLPSARSAAFAAAVRLALVERVLDVEAGEDGGSREDAFARVIAVAYRGAASGVALTTAEREAIEQPLAAESAAGLGERARREVRAGGSLASVRFGVEALERRRQSRLVAVRGEMRVFAAEQVSLAEALASAIEVQRPGDAAAARGIIDEMHAVRRAARTVQGQMAEVERAMTRLWMLRLGPRLGPKVEVVR